MVKLRKVLKMVKRKIKLRKKHKTDIDKYPLVEIRWYDISSDSSWMSIDDLMSMELPECNTKGHLLSQTKGVTRIFGDYAIDKTGDIDELGNVTIIPTSVIIEIKKIS